MDAKRLIDSGLNTAMMVSFAVPGGAPVGIALAAALFVFDLLEDAVNPPPPPAPPLTQAELQNSLDALKADVINAIWKGQADTIVTDLVSLNKGFSEVWAAMQKLQVDGQRYVPLIPDTTTKQWVADTNTYFDLDATTGVLTRLRAYRQSITTSSLNDPSLTPLQVAEHRTSTVGLYCLIGSLEAAYLKAAVAWNWGFELLEAWQYQEYQKAVEHWRKQNAAYQAAHPMSGIVAQFPGVNLDPSYTPPAWNSWINEPGCPVPMLQSAVADMLSYCVTDPAAPAGTPPGLYTMMKAHWDDFESQMAAFDVALPAGAAIHAADIQKAVSQSVRRAPAWDNVVSTYAFADVTEDVIIQFGKAIDLWRATAAAVRFRTQTVAAGDTLASLAKAAYGDASLATTIYDLNRDQLSDPSAALVPGTLLKIYDKDALADLTPGKVGN